MAKILEVAIRNVAGNYHLQIREQLFDRVQWTSPSGYEFHTASSPQMKINTFYMRGSMKSRHLNWTPFPNGLAILNFLRALGHYAASYDAGVSTTVLNTELILCVTTEFQNEFDANTCYNWLENLETTDVDGVPEIKECNDCSKKDVTLKIISSPFGRKRVCLECMKKYKNCLYCGNATLDIKEHTDSLGQRKEICPSCYMIANCMSCGFKELSHDMRNVRIIDEEGENQNRPECLRCSKNKKKCEHRGCFYDVSYPMCPCQVPKDFKKYIHPHNANVCDHLPMDSDCMLGMELEVGVEYKHRPYFIEVYNHTKDLIGNDAITVYDSSIDYTDRDRGIFNKYRGFEIVTRPLNLRNMLKFIKKFTQNKHSLLRSWDVETAGIHIHISRRLLTRCEQGKLLVFINHKDNRRLIKYIARRYNARFARLEDKKITDYKDMSPECHYHAINTNKPHTIEFRIFRGSLKEDTLKSYIQFVMSSIEFVKQTPTENLLSNVYLQWLSSTDRSKYRELKTYLKDLQKRGSLVYVGGDN